jgi:acetyl-CoA acetyltransferase
VIRRQVAIAGIGQTAYGKKLPGTAWELAIEAVLAACADAGLDPADVDGIVTRTYPLEDIMAGAGPPGRVDPAGPGG